MDVDKRVAGFSKINGHYIGSLFALCNREAASVVNGYQPFAAL